MTGLYFYAFFQLRAFCAGLFAARKAPADGKRSAQTGRSIKSVMNQEGGIYAANETAYPAELQPAAPAAYPGGGRRRTPDPRRH